MRRDPVGRDGRRHSFTWYGFSFGAVVGLQLAARTDRLTGLICGGWPPLGAQYAETLAFVEAQVAKGLPLAYTQNFYGSIKHWPDRD